MQGLWSELNLLELIKSPPAFRPIILQFEIQPEKMKTVFRLHLN